MSSPTLPYPYSMNPGPYSTWPALLTSPDYPDNAQIPGYDTHALMPYGFFNPFTLAANVDEAKVRKPVSTGHQLAAEVADRVPSGVYGPSSKGLYYRWNRGTERLLEGAPGKAWTAPFDHDRKLMALPHLKPVDPATVRAKSIGKARTWSRSSQAAAPAERTRTPPPQRPGATSFLTAILQGAGVVPRQAAAAAVPYEPAGTEIMPTREEALASTRPKWLVPVAVGGGVLLVAAIIFGATRKKR